jgi:hypothetical protein
MEMCLGPIFLLCSLSSLTLAGLLLWKLPTSRHKGDAVIESLFWAWIAFMWGIGSLSSGSARTWLTERGIQFGLRLLAWDRIESWQWKTGDGQSLVLTLKKGPGVLWGRVKES